MKNLLIVLVAIVAFAGLSTSADAVLVKVLVDDFSDPAGPAHTSSPGGTTVPVGTGTDIVTDRTLMGRSPLSAGPFDPGALVAGGGDLDINLAPVEMATVSWTTGGFDFVAAIASNIVLVGLTNFGATPAMLSIDLLQNGAVVDTQAVTLAVGETEDVNFLAIAGPTAMLAFDIYNVGATPLTMGVTGQVVANPEPATMALMGLGVLGGAIGYRRRRKDDAVEPVIAA